MSPEDIPNEFTKNRLNKVQKQPARRSVRRLHRFGGLRWERRITKKKETFAAIGRYDGAFGAPVCDLWFVGADGAVLEEENFVFKSWKSWEALLCCIVATKCPGVSDMLFGVQEQGAVRLLKQMGHFELDDDGDLMAWTAGTEAAPGIL